MTRLAIVGLGPAGLATSVAFAMNGHDFVAFDVNQKRVDQITHGEIPFYEPGLDDALKKVLKAGRLDATQEARRAVPDADIIFLCVGTPSRPDGSMDDAFLKQAAQDIVDAATDNNPIIVVKSKVLPGTTECVIRPILESTGKPFGLAVNFEFLREGHALEDSLHPDRIVLGVDGPDSAQALQTLFVDAQCPIVETDIRTA